MKFLDTNVILRFLTRDDEAKAAESAEAPASTMASTDAAAEAPAEKKPEA